MKARTKKKAVRKVAKKSTSKKPVKKNFSASELKAAAKQLGSRGGKATARKMKVKKNSKRNTWLG